MCVKDFPSRVARINRFSAGIVGAALIISASGCATTTPTLAASKSVSADRILAFGSPAGNSARLVVVRDRAFAGSIINYHLLVDGTLAAKVGGGEVVTLFVDPGERILEVRHPSATMGAVGDSDTVRAEDGVACYFRINSDLGQIRLLRTTAESVGAQ
jgi:hypothetical protein